MYVTRNFNKLYANCWRNKQSKQILPSKMYRANSGPLIWFKRHFHNFNFRVFPALNFLIAVNELFCFDRITKWRSRLSFIQIWINPTCSRPLHERSIPVTVYLSREWLIVYFLRVSDVKISEENSQHLIGKVIMNLIWPILYHRASFFQSCFAALNWPALQVERSSLWKVCASPLKMCWKCAENVIFNGRKMAQK